MGYAYSIGQQTPPLTCCGYKLRPSELSESGCQSDYTVLAISIVVSEQGVAHKTKEVKIYCGDAYLHILRQDDRMKTPHKSQEGLHTGLTDTLQ